MNLYKSGLKQSGGGTGNTEVYIDGVKSSANRIDLNNPLVAPISTYMANVVSYNNELHLLNKTEHYKFDGSEWVSVSTIPFLFQGFAVVCNNEIHILNRVKINNQLYHYKWNGTNWISVSTIPYYFHNVVVYNNEIHILGGQKVDSPSTAKYHYKWNGSTWVSVSTLPYDFASVATVYNDEIHILGNGYSSDSDIPYMKAHYKWDGESWVSVSTLPMDNSYEGTALQFNNKLHFFSNYYGVLFYYVWDGTSWAEQNIKINYPFYASRNKPACVFNNKIYICGAPASGINTAEIVGTIIKQVIIS